MANIKLISVDVLYDLTEPGDSVFFTTKWQCIEKTEPKDIKISAELTFSGRQRREEAQSQSFRMLWEPFPYIKEWKKGEVWSVTGSWKVPATWGGSFFLDISLTDNKGENIQFIGENGFATLRQRICELDIGWGWGRKKLLEQRNPLHIQLNKENSDNVDISKHDCTVMSDFGFNNDYPAICSFNNNVLWYDLRPILTVRKISDNFVLEFIGNDGIDYSLKNENGKIIYSAFNKYCAFDFIAEKSNYGFVMSIQNVREADGYEIIDFEVPSLIQIFDKKAEIINFYGGGRRQKLSEALMQSVNFYYDVCNAVSACSGNESFALIANDPDMCLRQSVVKCGSNDKSIVMGATFRVHIKSEVVGTPSIPVNLDTLELHFNRDSDWKFSANILKNKIDKQNFYIYKDTLMYKIALDMTAQYNPERPETYSEISTLKDVEEIIMKIYNLSCGMRQVVYLCGWQKGGHDFSYPYPHLTGFNPKCGNMQEFRDLREKLKKYNVLLSFHDNYDDAYISDEVKLNRDIICIDETGKHWKGWLWAGGMSYIIDPSVYVKSEDFAERVEKTVSDYGIEDTYHLDVLTSEVRRYSYRKNKMSAARENIDAKLKIITAFNKKQIDITSETLAMPFIGKIGYAQNTRYNFANRLFYNEEVIPLTTVAFHGFIPYKFASSGSKISILRAIAVGGSCSISIENNIDFTNISRELYLSSIPMSKLAYKKVLDAQIDCDKWFIKYEDDSSVYVNFAKEEYKIVFENTVISENFTTFMLINNSTYCYYSLSDAEYSLNLPDKWEAAEVKTVTADGEGKKFVLYKKNGFVLNAKKDTLYFIRKG